MNFLAHYGAIPADDPSPMRVLGNALPDLLPLASSRARFRLHNMAAAPAGGVRDGVIDHLIADRAFHRSAAFLHAQDDVKFLLREFGLNGPRTRSFFVAHIFVELGLDAFLLRTRLDLAQSFYAAFGMADTGSASRWAEAAIGRPLPNLPGVLGEFWQSRYLECYRTDMGLADAVTRVCARAQGDILPSDRQVLEELTKRVMQTVSDRAPALIEETVHGIRQLSVIR